MTLLDINLIVVMLLSALLAAGRGLSRVMVAVVCCGIALLVPAHFTGFDESSIAINVALFLSALIALLALGARISHKVLDDKISSVDRALGFLLGLVRGFMIVVIAYLFYALLVPRSSQPKWIRDAESNVVLQGTGDWLMSMLPDSVDNQFDLIRSIVAGVIIYGIVLSIGVDFFAIVTRWMGRGSQRDSRLTASNIAREIGTEGPHVDGAAGATALPSQIERLVQQWQNGDLSDEEFVAAKRILLTGGSKTPG